MKKIKFDFVKGADGWRWEAYEDAACCRCLQVSWYNNRVRKWGYCKDRLCFGRLTVFYGKLPF